MASPTLNLGEDDPFQLLLQNAQAQLQVLSDTVNSLAQRYNDMKYVPVENLAMHFDFDDDKDSAVSSDPQEVLVSSKHKSQIGEGSSEKASELQPFDCDKPSAESSHPQDALLTALALGHLKEATQALRNGADPNMTLNIRCFRKVFFNCSPLAIAVLKGHDELANLLCRSKADPNATYSFEAGRKLKLWTGPIAFATTVKGNHSLLLDLIGYRADVHKTASNGASLVWQAGYMGHVEMCQTVIEMQADIEQKAANVDDEELQHSPVHTAAITGRVPIIELLVQSKARLDVTDGKGNHPLDDAVLEGHGQVLKLLISSGANPWQRLGQQTASKLLHKFSSRSTIKRDSGIPEASSSPPRESKLKRSLSLSSGLDFSSTSPSVRSIDIVFKNKNPLLISAIAQGLSNAPSMLDQMSLTDFLRFLRCPGDAPLHIMDAVFSDYAISSWGKDDEGELVRANHHSAFTPADGGMVVMSGPHYHTLKELFDNKKEPPDQTRKFLDQFVPSKPTLTKKGLCRGRNRRKVFAKITCTMCHVSGLHEDLEVLMSIVHSPSMQLFESRGCRAIIQYKWVQEQRGALFYTALTFVEVINLFLINLVLNFQEHEVDRYRHSVLSTVNVFAGVVWLVVLFLDICKLIGYRRNGLLPKLIASWMFWYQIVLMTTTLGVLIAVALTGLEVNSNESFRICFGLVILLKWSKFLSFSTRAFRVVGVSILPILKTMLDIGPFCCVLSVVIFGLTNLYYALGLYDSFDSFMLMYRMAVLGDADLTELEGPANKTMGSKDVEDNSLIKHPYYYAIRSLYLAVSFIVGLITMNVSVAVLCDKYSKAEQSAEAAFTRERARVILDNDAIRQGFRYISCRKRNQEQKKEQLWIVQRQDSDL